ncbi:MAG TPA: hypothetical protein VGU61_19765 [Noviherbaspirillum sp.]|jgi:hypothetical protein|uniref:hypothetical protein n=1 Tax=Noviherbaspirillum sp. TaxID=1926288 RepID=UPI002DDD8043|nr:hypothetical protein [Noviherbaspirillum sp.]HEV2612509.1 hypothetical protein [Noviherbaspirillum sp.]
MNDMERRVEALTKTLWKQCEGKGAAVAIGASLNIIMTAAQMVPDKLVRAGLAASFRKIADSLEQQNSERRQ